MSKFGLYYFGYSLVLGAQFLMKSVFAASKLGDVEFFIPINAWTIFVPMAICIILELIDTFVHAAGGSQQA